MIETLNIFRWATKELSQDAFICWMLSWADPKAKAIDPGMHQGGLTFLNALLSLHGEPPVVGMSVTVATQIRHTDVIALIGEDRVVLIEDKTDGKDPAEKLRRGVLAIQDAYPKKRVMPVYFKTGDQGNYAAVHEANYKIYMRRDLLRDLRAMAVQCKHNAIFTDFLAHMERREYLAQSYERSEVSDWSLYAWQGFFLALQEKFQDMDWDVVNPPSGAFMAAYWHYEKWGSWDTYLQIEEDLLVMKMNFWGEMDRPTRTRIREQWFGILAEAAKGGPISIQKPRRSGVGMTMTAAHIGTEGEWMCKGPDGYLDLNATVKYLRLAMTVLDKARAQGTHIVPGEADRFA